MASAEQLTFWEKPLTEEHIMWGELADLKTRQNNLRRGIFYRFDELEREVEALKNQISFLIGHKKGQ